MRKWIIECVVVICLGAGCFGETIRVALDGSGDYSTIQAGIDAAVDGDTVIVADGTYRGDGNRDIDFWGKAITVRSENGPENCVVDSQGSGPDPHRGFYFHSGEGNDSIVEGFKIINGSTLGGAGIFGRDSSPVIRGCTFIHNHCLKNSGGGINIAGENPQIIGCFFHTNGAERGGAIACGGGRIINCLMIYNSATRGGGIYCMSEDVEIINCTISKNKAIYAGGGVYCGYYSDVQVVNCIIRNNFSPYRDREKNLDLAVGWDSHLTVRYSNVKGGLALIEGPERVTWGSGNIDVPAWFVSTGLRDYHLSSLSPCIDAGTNVPVTVSTDMDGRKRIRDGNDDGLSVIDMGAYEYVDPLAAPIADAGDDVTVAADGQGTAVVILDGSRSYDDNGDDLEYFWFYEGQLFGEGMEIEAELGRGTFVFSLIVNDGTQDSEPDDVVIAVIDETAPKLRVGMDRRTLWPANNRMVEVTPRFVVSDNCGGEVSIELIGITCNQESANDINITDEGIFLRAKRDGHDRDGRVYTLAYRATDESGNETTASAEVVVPHDLRRRGRGVIGRDKRQQSRRTIRNGR